MQLVDQDSLLIDVIPKRLPSSDEDIADYIFKRNRVFPGGTVAGSSMLLFDRALADIVPFDVHLPIHDDWDWLLNVQESTGTRMSFSSEVLMQYTRNPIGTSLSSSSRAAESAKWFQGRKSALSPQQFGDGLLCYSVPLALQQHQWREAFRLLKSSLCSGRPGIRSFIFVTLIFLKEVLLLNAAGTLIVTKFTQNRLKVVMPDLPS